MDGKEPSGLLYLIKTIMREVFSKRVQIKQSLWMDMITFLNHSFQIKIGVIMFIKYQL